MSIYLKIKIKSFEWVSIKKNKEGNVLYCFTFIKKGVDGKESIVAKPMYRGKTNHQSDHIMQIHKIS